MKKQDHILARYALFVVGLMVAAMGSAFSVRGGLGTSPVASFPYSVSLVSPLLTFGGWLNVLSMIQIAVQVILLRRQCNPLEIAVQTVLAFFYGYMTDFSCMLISGISASTYIGQLGLMLTGCVISAFGIWLQFMGKVAMLPGEAMNRAISQVTGKRYESIKILFDILYVSSAAAVCLVFLGRLEGVREGSVIAAILIGNIIRLFNRGWQTMRKHVNTAGR